MSPLLLPRTSILLLKHLYSTILSCAAHHNARHCCAAAGAICLQCMQTRGDGYGPVYSAYSLMIQTLTKQLATYELIKYLLSPVLEARR